MLATRRRARSRLGALTLGVALLGAPLALGAAPATAGTTIPSIPQTNPVDTTPRVVDGGGEDEAGVRELRQVGSTMYAGGEFQRVQNASRTTTYTRTNLFSFNATTGAVSSFAPAVNGAVYAMEATADGRYLYVGGDFRNFAGTTVNRLVKVDLTTGRIDTRFRFPVSNARVSDLQLVGSRLFVSGTFPGGLVAVNPDTGARTTYFNGVQTAGAEERWSNRVYRFSVNPAATRMVILGSFQTVAGQPRQQAAMLTLGDTSATLSQWYSDRFNAGCFASLEWYTRDVDWTPDGSSFAIATTGGGFPGDPVRLCDTVSLWQANDAPRQQPLWINYSGGDTFHSVAVTNRAVFASGHFRWLDNPLGRDTMGAGAVVRQGIGAMDLTTGRATSWNPGKGLEGGLGGFDLYFTSRGLWIGHFERGLGRSATGAREIHEGLGLFPF